MSSQGSGGLGGVWAKVGRAKELLDTVNDEVTTWLNQYPNPIKVCRDDKMRIDEFIWNISDDPPTQVALLVGDAIHNLRTSLDHLVWALSTTRGRTIPKGRQRDIEFPILSDPDPWPKVVKKNLRYVDAAAQTIIESLQPYNGTNPFLMPYGLPTNFDLSEYDPLVVLHNWDIIDKHRTLYTMGVNAYGGFPTTDYGGKFEMLHPRTVEYGTKIAWIQYDYFGPPPPHSEMDVDVNFPGDVKINEDPPTWGLSRSVGDIYEFVAFNVIPRFEEFF